MKAEELKTDCGCEGSCPICRFGEVENHKCNKCKTEFCPVCHGTLEELPKRLPKNVVKCECTKVRKTLIDSIICGINALIGHEKKTS